MARDTLTTVAVIGGAAVLGYELLRDRKGGDDERPHRDRELAVPPDSTDSSAKRGDRGPGPLVWPTMGTWIVPVPIWQGRHPVVSDGWGTPRPGGRFHRGADLMFARASGDPFKPGSPNGAAHHVMPDNIPALAAADGVIWSADWTARGFTIVVDHGDWATYYTHLTALLVRATQRATSGQRVRAGDPIGMIGADPLDGAHLKHLHFELWHGSPADAVDPEPYLRTWQLAGDPRGAGASPPLVAARNLSSYRPVGNPGEPYPDWLRALDGKPGVASIRSRKDGKVLYIGESTDNLYKGLTRHFQEWRRVKGFPKNNPKEGHDPGVTYNRDAVEVAIEPAPASRALSTKKKMIERLAPRDNVHFNPKD
jgi:hypothetical protein